MEGWWREGRGWMREEDAEKEDVVEKEVGEEREEGVERIERGWSEGREKVEG